jgi:Fic family protein
MDANLKVKLAQIDEAKAEVDSLRPLKPEQETKIFQKFRLDWNYHSNAIEGNKLTLGETALYLSEGLTANGKPLKDHLDLSGHDEVIGFLTSFIHRDEALTEAVIRHLHKVMLVKPYKIEAKTSEGRVTQKLIEIGEYKTEPNEVVTPSGAIHRYPLPQDIPAKMAELINWFRNSSQEEHPVLRAAIFHYEFTAIHPFADGNGRMARILMNLILMQAGFPPVVIKIGERDKYVSGLVHADNGDRLPFYHFIAEKALASLALYLKGARGEPLEEEDDIDKKIALFKQQLTDEPDPVVFSEEVYLQCINQSISLFLRKLVSKLSNFDDLFVESKLTVVLNGHAIGISNYSSSLEDLLNKFKKVTASTSSPIHLQFVWMDFKKGKGKNFNYTVECIIRFSKLTYSVSIEPEKVVKLYSDSLDAEESIELVNKVAEKFLHAVQKFRASVVKG